MLLRLSTMEKYDREMSLSKLYLSYKKNKYPNYVIFQTSVSLLINLFMKYIVVLGIGLIFISNVQAQSSGSKDSALSALLNNKYFFNHTNTFQKNNNPAIFNFRKKLNPIDPCVLQLVQPKLAFIENVNHSNIYKSSPDNMFIIKPDSTILFNMPVADNNQIF